MTFLIHVHRIKDEVTLKDHAQNSNVKSSAWTKPFQDAACG